MSSLEFRCHLPYASGFVLDADFTTAARVTALFGPSGSGKTSVLSILAGLRVPESGFIRFGDRVLFDSTHGINLQPEARRIGYVFQQHLLFPHLSVRDNLLFGWTRRPAKARAIDPKSIIRVLELHELLDRRPGTLSGGQRQRIALGRALLCAPELLLLDEPLASVDEELKQQVLQFVERILSEWQITTLYVTHNITEAEQFCQWIVQLCDGRVAAVGAYPANRSASA